jgi:hypothetical protein
VALCQARISTKPLWGFSSSNPYHSQSRAEQLRSQYKGKGWGGEGLSYWLGTIVTVLLIMEEPIGQGRVREGGREGAGTE